MFLVLLSHCLVLRTDYAHQTDDICQHLWVTVGVQRHWLTHRHNVLHLWHHPRSRQSMLGNWEISAVSWFRFLLWSRPCSCFSPRLFGGRSGLSVPCEKVGPVHRDESLGSCRSQAPVLVAGTCLADVRRSPECVPCLGVAHSTVSSSQTPLR